MKTSAPLSKVQYGLYVECVSHQGEAFYNLPYLYELDGSLDGERLRRAVIAALKSHPTIFTRIVLDDDGEPLQTIDLDTLEPAEASKERSDVCAVPACAVVAEGEMAFVLANAYLEKFGHDNMADIRENIAAYKQRLKTVAR